MYARSGQTAEAEQHYRRSLCILQDAFGDTHPKVVLGLHNLGVLYFTRGRLLEARQLFEQALEAARHLPTPDPQAVAQELHYLAEAHRRMSKHRTAEPLFLEALQILESSRVFDRSYALCLKDYAKLLGKTGRKEESKKFWAMARNVEKRSHQSAGHTIHVTDLAFTQKDR
jgi:tetratricopeptide (TPR) repeat protein